MFGALNEMTIVIRVVVVVSFIIIIIKINIGIIIIIYVSLSLLCRPDMTFAVDWALSNNYLSISLLYLMLGKFNFKFTF